MNEKLVFQINYQAKENAYPIEEQRMRDAVMYVLARDFEAQELEAHEFQSAQTITVAVPLTEERKMEETGDMIDDSLFTLTLSTDYLFYLTFLRYSRD